MNYEKIPEHCLRMEKENKFLEIKNLRKTFGKFVAVHGLNLNMYMGQIFALLGHNGAGKTTTINCLTGMLGKSSGNAEVLGIDVFNNPSKLRRIMGMCPQHNILFPLLTPWEHLSMISDFKGASWKNKNSEIRQVL